MTNPNEHTRQRLADLELIARIIPRQHLEPEAELLITKWPAYRFLSPMAATKQFHRAFVESYKRYIRTNIDYEMAEKSAIGARIEFDQQNAHLTQLWRARQIADGLGMPYEAYMDFVFDFASCRIRQNIPQPNQLGPSPTSKIAWFAKLNKYWTPDHKMIWLNRMEPMVQYSMAHNKDLPAQEQFRRDLVDAARAVGGNPAPFVQKRVVALNQLSLSECAIFGEATVDGALRDVPREIEIGLLSIHEYAQPQPAEFMQSCFGVPGITTSTSETCQGCPT